MARQKILPSKRKLDQSGEHENGKQKHKVGDIRHENDLSTVTRLYSIALVFAVLYSWSPSTSCTYGINMPSNINKIAADLSQFFHVSSVFAKSVSPVSMHMTERRVHA